VAGRQFWAPGEIGELITRNLNGETKVEYHGMPEASAAKTRGGWLRTGDMAHRDEDGWLYFDFRKGGGLRRQGEFIMPEYVEGVIAEHPDVIDVCVCSANFFGAPGKVTLSQPSSNVDQSGYQWRSALSGQAGTNATFTIKLSQIPKTPREKLDGC
jgi:crotonobetaine/carnitine-CoA ligase